MADAAAHLVEEVLPEVPVRQSVCTLPWASRKRAGYKRALCIDISEAFVASLTTELRQRGKRHIPDGSHDQSLSFLTDRSVCRRSPMSDADRRRSPSSSVTTTASSTSAAFAAHVLVCVHYACTVHALCRQAADRGDRDGAGGAASHRPRGAEEARGGRGPWARARGARAAASPAAARFQVETAEPRASWCMRTHVGRLFSFASISHLRERSSRPEVLPHVGSRGLT